MAHQQDAALRVVQITDTHIQSRPHGQLGGVDVDAGLNAVLAHLQTHHWPADFILATGDLVQDEGVPAYERWREFFAPLNVPVYCLPGNHDLPDDLAAVFDVGTVRCERQVMAGNWLIILLDSTLPGSAGGHLAASELRFLEQELAARPDCYALVCLHHHPVPIGSQWLDTMVVDNAAELFTVLDRHPQVRGLIWGHIHQVFEDRRNGVQLLGAPSTCAQFAPALNDPQYQTDAPGYRWLELHPDGCLVSGVERVPLPGG